MSTPPHNFVTAEMGRTAGTDVFKEPLTFCTPSLLEGTACRLLLAPSINAHTLMRERILASALLLTPPQLVVRGQMRLELHVRLSVRIRPLSPGYSGRLDSTSASTEPGHSLFVIVQQARAVSRPQVGHNLATGTLFGLSPVFVYVDYRVLPEYLTCASFVSLSARDSLLTSSLQEYTHYRKPTISHRLSRLHSSPRRLDSLLADVCALAIPQRREGKTERSKTRQTDSTFLCAVQAYTALWRSFISTAKYPSSTPHRTRKHTNTPNLVRTDVQTAANAGDDEHVRLDFKWSPAHTIVGEQVSCEVRFFDAFEEEDLHYSLVPS
ncbi:unnamed protein product [Protopolystoma xenopodis]|uniref:Uncharacterized protein n=1 Tax=Protopolystoma xenopodis TaxID=117903 RepID=A0A3S5C493_9PLAT|nr:unnamed protein product [Protopolystoma xenopodis]